MPYTPFASPEPQPKLLSRLPEGTSTTLPVTVRAASRPPRSPPRLLTSCPASNRVGIQAMAANPWRAGLPTAGRVETQEVAARGFHTRSIPALQYKRHNSESPLRTCPTTPPLIPPYPPKRRKKKKNIMPHLDTPPGPSAAVSPSPAPAVPPHHPSASTPHHQHHHIHPHPLHSQTPPSPHSSRSPRP